MLNEHITIVCNFCPNRVTLFWLGLIINLNIFETFNMGVDEESSGDLKIAQLIKVQSFVHELGISIHSYDVVQQIPKGITKSYLLKIKLKFDLLKN